MGSWIGSDRDGNPFVTADVMRGTLRMQGARVLRYYLDELHELGRELSLAADLTDVSPELRGLAERSADTSPHRRGEPYRLAVSGIYARLSATALKLNVDTLRPPYGKAAPYASAAEFSADLDVLHRSLTLNHSEVIARGRLRHLRRAADCFGFHLACLDLRQNSAVHERTVAELLDAATPGTSYLALGEEARIECWCANCATRGRWRRHLSPTAMRRWANWRCSMPRRRRTACLAPARSLNASSR